jgi:hypothetical protein
MTGGFCSEAASAGATRSADGDGARERLVEPGSSGWSGGKLGSIGVLAPAGRPSAASIWLGRSVDSAAIASVDATSVCKCSSYLPNSGCGTAATPCAGSGGAGANAAFGRSLVCSGAMLGLCSAAVSVVPCGSSNRSSCTEMMPNCSVGLSRSACLDRSVCLMAVSARSTGVAASDGWAAGMAAPALLAPRSCSI